MQDIILTYSQTKNLKELLTNQDGVDFVTVADRFFILKHGYFNLVYYFNSGNINTYCAQEEVAVDENGNLLVSGTSNFDIVCKSINKARKYLDSLDAENIIKED